MGDKMESPKFEKTSQAEKVALFLEKWRTVLIIVFALLIAVIVGVSIFNAVHSSNDKAVIGEVDKIAYELTENSAQLSSEELEVRRENALSKLKPYLSKGCVGGSAANRLQAEILYSKKDYKNASEYYLAAAKKNKLHLIYMSKNLMIVESPSKGKTIAKYLGKDFRLMSSQGHIRDIEGVGKNSMGIDFNNGYTPNYVIDKDKLHLVEALRKEALKADKVWLASDPDRERSTAEATTRPVSRNS